MHDMLTRLFVCIPFLWRADRLPSLLAVSVQLVQLVAAGCNHRRCLFQVLENVAAYRTDVDICLLSNHPDRLHRVLQTWNLTLYSTSSTVATCNEPTEFEDNQDLHGEHRHIFQEKFRQGIGLCARDACLRRFQETIASLLCKGHTAASSILKMMS